MNVKMKINNQKPCDCSFCTERRATTDRQLRNSLTNLETQFKKSRKKREEYEKTVRLLRLVDKTPHIGVSYAQDDNNEGGGGG